MTDYTQAVDFSNKDALPSGNPAKVIKGLDVDGELTLISVAIASKANKIVGGTSGNIVTRGATGDIVDSGFAPASFFRRNIVNNPVMNIWQRNTSFSSIANATFSADRWNYQKVGAAIHTISRQTDVPTAAQAGFKLNYSLQANLTTADTAIAAGDFVFINQPIEGYNWQFLAQNPCVLSFWVKAGITGTYCVALRNAGSDRSYVGTYTISAANVWEKKTVTYVASPSAGTWDYINGVGARLIFTLAAGTTFQTTAGAWQTGNFFATSGQVNGVNTGAGNFLLTGVQLEPGTASTNLEFINFEADLAQCQRYYEKSYDYIEFPGNTTTSGEIRGRRSGANYIAIASYSSRKRAPPTMSLFSPATGAAGVWRNNTTTTDASVSELNGGERHCTMACTGTSDGDDISGHWVASAEL